MSRRRDLGSIFDEVVPGESPEPTKPASRLPTVDEPIINDEARQMLEERSRAVGEAATRAAELAAQKGMELGRAALGALGRMKVERQRRAEEKCGARKEKCEGLLEGLTPEEVRAVLADPGVREAIAPLVYDGMGQLPSELSSRVDVLVADQPVSPVGQGSIGMTTAPELIPTAKRSYKRAALIGGGVLVLAVLGGATYWWSARSAPAPVIAPKSEGLPVVKPAPGVAPAVVPTEPAPVPVVEPVVAPAPIEGPEATVPVIEPAPEPVVAPGAAPTPVVSAPALRPTPIKPRPKKVEIAPATQAPKTEDQQIEQIRDFGKQLESLGGG